MHEKGFTLIELLVVIAIIAVLAVVVVLTLNPAGLLQESRDSNRLSDMATLQSAIGTFLADVPTANALGSANTLYVSIPDPAASSTSGSDCTSLGLPSLSGTGFVYHCAASSTYRMANGSGWIPVNFSQASFGVPLATLPIDPVNVTSSGLFYSYVTNGQQYEVTSLFESQKYKIQFAQNPLVPGYPGVNAKGNSLALNPLWSPQGLTGYWTFDEGTGTVANDLSGNNIPLSIGVLGVSTQWGLGKFGTALELLPAAKTSTSSCPAAAMTNTPIGTPLYQIFNNAFTYAVWERVTQSGALLHFYTPFLFDGSFNGVWIKTTGASLANDSSQNITLGFGLPTDNRWHYFVYVFDLPNGKQSAYLDGQLIASASNLTGLYGPPSSMHVGTYDANWCGAGHAMTGAEDNLRIYNRALSTAEIQALYNAER